PCPYTTLFRSGAAPRRPRTLCLWSMRRRSGVAGLRELHRRGHEPRDRPEREAALARLRVVLDVDDDDLAGPDLLEQELLGDRVLDQPLDGPTQRTGAELRVVALVGQEVLGLLRELQAQALALELALHPL